ncbi:MAG: hypothetical protein DCC49_12460 [Acidobacteria bacterium]|nr:MAG: hypothetical protein DCC49_12460 [Acidobacteriota bacterium]
MGEDDRSAEEHVMIAQVLPWMVAAKKYVAGEIELLPIANLETDHDELDDAELAAVRNVMSSYRTLQGAPVPGCTLVQFSGRSALEDLTDEELDTARTMVELACFASLSRRAFFGSLDYANATRFTFYQQRLGSGGFVTLAPRVREGRALHAQSTTGLAISEPIQVAVKGRIRIDEPLWIALCDLRSGFPEPYRRWHDAILGFNAANTDSDDIGPEAEWVLMAGSFQRLLEAQSKADDLADAFDRALTPAENVACAQSARRPNCKGDDSRNLRWAWMHEFYRLRNEYAHGKRNSAQNQAWNQQEHLILAAIAFPLVAKVKLQELGYYTLTDSDSDRIDSFECLADQEDFFAEPPGMKGTGDSIYSRLLSEASDCRARERMIAALDSNGGSGSNEG